MCLKILVGSSWDLNLLPLRGGGGTVHAVQEVGGGGGGGVGAHVGGGVFL